MRLLVVACLALSPLATSTIALAESTMIDTALDPREIVNGSWWLAREADGLGDAATLLGFATLHDLADRVRDEAQILRRLAKKRLDEGEKIVADDQLREAFTLVEKAAAELATEWKANRYEENRLLRNNYNEMRSRLERLSRQFAS